MRQDCGSIGLLRIIARLASQARFILIETSHETKRVLHRARPETLASIEERAFDAIAVKGLGGCMSGREPPARCFQLCAGALYHP